MTQPAHQFPWSDDELRKHLTSAVQHYWGVRDGQSGKQRAEGKLDAGMRGEVTGGQHLNAFVHLLNDLIRVAGFTEDEIRFRRGVELPGYYRPMKKWDIVVTRNGRLCAVVEMKSQVGPSFGNNFNNRSEEAIGSSTDFWVAFREGALGKHQPWIGYFLMVEETIRSTKPVRLVQPAFKPMPLFVNTSYIQRYAILCQRLVLERNYTSACLLTSPRGSDGTYSEPQAELAFATFAKSLFGHLVGVV